MGVVNNRYNNSIMSAIDMIANEGAQIKAEKRDWERQKQGFRAQQAANQASNVHDLNMERFTGMRGLMDDSSLMPHVRENVGSQYMGEMGLQGDYGVQPGVIAPEVLEYEPQFGQFQWSPEEALEINKWYSERLAKGRDQDTAQMNAKANQTRANAAYKRAANAGAKASGSGGSGKGAALIDVPEQLLPFTGGKDQVSEDIYQQAQRDYNANKFMKAQNAVEELDIRANSIEDQLNGRGKDSELGELTGLYEALEDARKPKNRKRHPGRERQVLAKIQQLENELQVIQMQRLQLLSGLDSEAIRRLMPGNIRPAPAGGQGGTENKVKVEY